MLSDLLRTIDATALEAALKMTETSYLVAKPYSGADFLHGPIAMVSDGFPCLLFAPDGRAYPSPEPGLGIDWDWDAIGRLARAAPVVIR